MIIVLFFILFYLAVFSPPDESGVAGVQLLHLEVEGVGGPGVGHGDLISKILI